jgi:hypothetical protein
MSCKHEKEQETSLNFTHKSLCLIWRLEILKRDSSKKRKFQHSRMLKIKSYLCWQFISNTDCVRRCLRDFDVYIYVLNLSWHWHLSTNRKTDNWVEVLMHAIQKSRHDIDSTWRNCLELLRLSEWDKFHTNMRKCERLAWTSLTRVSV